ncbi:MAG: hypothetical protein ABW185_10670, partial [Sedimenticola sp.]
IPPWLTSTTLFIITRRKQRNSDRGFFKLYINLLFNYSAKTVICTVVRDGNVLFVTKYAPM